jgi:hypothetical protein
MPETEQRESGRLSEVVRMRAASATPERPFVIEHREALIYMLGEAAELEHSILCQYLFAAVTLKQSVQEGVSERQLEAIRHWRKTVLEVAGQEMLHLALVQNLRTAIGAAPHLTRPNLPCPARHFPPGVQIALVPFGEQALRHFLYLERPEGLDLDDAEGFAAIARAEPLRISAEDIVPVAQDFATVGHLYRAIEEGFAHLAAKLGEQGLFIGPPRAQATPESFGWPELLVVTDLVSARRALETIVEQGEGASGDWRKAHFGRFHDILDDYIVMQKDDPRFEPARPVLAANVRPPESGVEVPLIGDPLTARVVDLFNVAYEMLLQVLYRFFAHTEETDRQLILLASVAFAVMQKLIRPLGSLITELPVGPEYPGMMAGPSFELFYEADYFFPHRDAAWIVLEERMREAASYARRLAAENPGVGAVVEPVAAAADELAHRLAEGRTPPANQVEPSRHS